MTESMYVWVDNGMSEEDVLSALSTLPEEHTEMPSRGRSLNASFKRNRANSVGVIEVCSGASCTPGHSDEDSASSGSQTPPTRSLTSKGRVRSKKEQVAVAIKTKMELLRQHQEAEQRAHAASVEGKPAAVTAAVVTFMMAMLSGPLGSCIPQTHLHLSRLPIATGHSVVIDALKREWPDHEFDIKLHVYQKTRHVSGIAAVTPGLSPSDLEALRSRVDNLYLPLADCGDKMIVEESMRDRDPKLVLNYRDIVTQGLGCVVPGAAPLKVTTKKITRSPIVYLRIMADRTQTNGLLTCVSEIKDEGLLYILDRFDTLINGKPLSDSIKFVAPDKSANRQHMHRSHFGRAYFLECTDEEAAFATMKAIQKDSIQNVDGMKFSLHVEMKKMGGSRDSELGGGRLFEQDPAKRAHVERRLENAKKVVEGLCHQPCGCLLPERHTMAVHSLFSFRGVRSNTYMPIPAETSTTYAESTCCNESMYGDGYCNDTGSIADYTTEVSVESYQPYSFGYGFPSWWTSEHNHHAPSTRSTDQSSAYWNQQATQEHQIWMAEEQQHLYQ
eukprot:TRINITY_DN9769_c0_g1_i2.p1 TRINITY_DN9769_c0_g1~~TRINITY_DN9769_c0_g1_i2.p1  ORF type:complete len:577 (+),score=130.15 TRINITY_DN9769_c0_g1_i2:62-1732(+)